MKEKVIRTSRKVRKLINKLCMRVYFNKDDQTKAILETNGCSPAKREKPMAVGVRGLLHLCLYLLARKNLQRLLNGLNLKGSSFCRAILSLVLTK